MRAAEAAKAAEMARAADGKAVLPVVTEEAAMLGDNDDEIDDTLSEKLVSDPMLIPNIPSSTAPRRQLAKARASVDVDIHDDFANHSEIAHADGRYSWLALAISKTSQVLARALLKDSFETIRLSDYAPHGIVRKDSEIHVTGIQAKKISKHTPVLVVKFLSPPSLKDTEIQLLCTSLEPKIRMGQGGDLTLFIAIRKIHPPAKTLHDIGVRRRHSKNHASSCRPSGHSLVVRTAC